MDEKKLRELLEELFDPDPVVLDAAVREVKRLDDSGLWEETFGEPLTAEALASNIKIAKSALKPSWNWWFGMAASFYDEEFERYQI